ncbi:hypothetical protein Micbo1qcDRAFT_163729, partial [Microdochium bolleyi]
MRYTAHGHREADDDSMVFDDGTPTADSNEVDIGVGVAQRDNKNEDTTTRVKIILAGEGRITPGIAKRKPVKPGIIVGIARPTWEIMLSPELGRWAVACDWALL